MKSKAHHKQQRNTHKTKCKKENQNQEEPSACCHYVCIYSCISKYMSTCSLFSLKSMYRHAHVQWPEQQKNKILPVYVQEWQGFYFLWRWMRGEDETNTWTRAKNCVCSRTEGEWCVSKIDVKKRRERESDRQTEMRAKRKTNQWRRKPVQRISQEKER